MNKKILTAVMMIPLLLCGCTSNNEEEHSCSYSQKSTDSKFLKIPASCDSAAVYYYSCECGKYNKNKTFTVGEALGHDFVNWYADEEYHYHECHRDNEGTICNTQSGKEKHTFDNGSITKQATSTQNGVKTYTCSICNYAKTEVIPCTSIADITNRIAKLPEITTLSSTDIDDIDNILNSLGDNEKALIPNLKAFNNAKTLLNSYNNIDFTSESVKQKVLVASAKAYYSQGNQIHYDQYTKRRDYNASPEDATAERRMYLDCSSFCNAVYNYSFKKEIIVASGPVSTELVNSYAKNNSSNADVLFYSSDLSTYRNNSSLASSKIQELKNILQPGDLYCYRHKDGDSEGGHIMFYAGNGYFYHSTGNANSFKLGTSNAETIYGDRYTKDEKNRGSIKYESVDSTVFNTNSDTNSDRYLFASSNTSVEFIRPMNRTDVSQQNLTNEAKVRYMYDGLSFEKTNNIGLHKSVVKGNNVTYTVKITNSSNAASSYVTIKEILPEHVTYQSNTGTAVFENNTLYWNIASVPAESSVSVSYTVKAENVAGKKIVDNDTYVNGIRCNMLANETKNNVTENSIKSKLETMVDQDYADTLAAAKSLYSSLKIDLSSITSTQYPITNGLNGGLYNSNANNLDITPTILYGGYRFRYTSENTYNRNQTKNLLPNYLEVGDLLFYEEYVTSNSSNYNLAIYGGNYIYAVENGKLARIKSSSNNVSYVAASNLTESIDEVTGFVHTMPFYYRFIVLRPTLRA